ncbi:MAG: PQQ-binding-like beta-propeller repeat protein [bacterium]|nr:PQQ-binding-like beta-propeller repeat protein [bacterium]
MFFLLRTRRPWSVCAAGLVIAFGYCAHGARARRLDLAEQTRLNDALDPGAVAGAQDWSHWRGAHRNGIVAEDSGWSAGSWPPKSSPWTVEVGCGATSPLVAGGRLYAMGWQDGRDTLFCFDAVSGEELWKQSYASPEYGRWAVGDQGFYKGPTSTPELDSATGLLFTLSTDGELSCWDTTRSGERQWHANLYDDFGVARRPNVDDTGQQRDYGYTTAPLVHGDWVIVEVGAEAGNLVAFDVRTGRRAWVSENEDAAGHTGGPVPIVVEGVPCLAILTLTQLVVTSLAEDAPGATIATYPWATAFANNIATPAVFENNVIVTSAYNQKAISRIRILPDRAEEVWRRPYPSKVCSPIIHDGHVYWAWRKMRCLDFATGEQRWAGGRFGDPGSCILTADERIVVWGHLGKLALVDTAKRSPDAYHELASVSRILDSRPWPHVVLHAGRIYCKNELGTIRMFVVGAVPQEPKEEGD